MSSQRQIDANRANGAKSHGPKTPEGLARCRAARLKHGLDSPHILLPRESRKKFETLRNAYIDELKPETPLELDCVDRMAAAVWRLHRVWRMEVDLIDVEAQTNQPKIKAEYDSCDKPAEHALAFQSLNDRTDSLALLHRKEAHYHATMDRALRTLERLRKLRGVPPPGTPVVGQAPSPAATPQSEVTEGPNSAGPPAPPSYKPELLEIPSQPISSSCGSPGNSPVRVWRTNLSPNAWLKACAKGTVWRSPGPRTGLRQAAFAAIAAVSCPSATLSSPPAHEIPDAGIDKPLNRC